MRKHLYANLDILEISSNIHEIKTYAAAVLRNYVCDVCLVVQFS